MMLKPKSATRDSIICVTLITALALALTRDSIICVTLTTALALALTRDSIIRPVPVVVVVSERQGDAISVFN